MPVNRTRPYTSPEVTADADALHAAAVAGDSHARDSLAALCLPRVRRLVLLSVGGGPDIDDVTQSAMARVFARLDSFRGEARFLTWVDRVTTNVISDHYRQRRWVVFLSFDEEIQNRQPIARDRPDDDLARQRLLERLASHFGHLRPKQRLPLVLSLVQGYTVPEIASLLGIGVEATKKRLLRGRRELVKRVRRDPACRDALQEMGR
jgi:RNA polymerase sigma-70 factor, ECF subfamily